ncbi:MAG: hypothetical protein K940chlam2_01523 [Chlamydiae bacterium]|nr:hypothetical protein [Chlamydiota bacterium]
MKKVILVLATLLLPTLAHAEANPTDPVTAKVIANAAHCVRACIGEKIYLNPERIHASNGRIYIDLNGEEGLVVPYLQYDSEGEYLLAHERIREFCRRGHSTNRRDRKCMVSDCPHYCGNPNG